MERFACKTAVFFGEDGLDGLKSAAPKRLLVVTDRRLSCPEAIVRLRDAAGRPETAFFEDFHGTPTMAQTVTGSHILRDFKPQLVAALGGQAAVDCAKAMRCFSRQDCLLAAIPVVPALGSEVSSQVTLLHNGQRHLLRDPAMAPEMAIGDTRLFDSASDREIRDTGFSLLAAGLESFALSRGNSLGELHARESFAAAFAALPGAVAGNQAARIRLHQASILAGLALEQTGLGLCRAMGNSLASALELPEGTIAALLLPALIDCNAHGTGKRYAGLSRAIGLGGSQPEIGARNLRSGLIRLRRELGLPGTLVQAGVELRRVWDNSRQIVAQTLEDSQCRNNPVAVDDFMVRRILETITGRL